MKIKKIAGVLLITVFLFPLVSFGATLRAGESFSLPKEETINDNLYIGAGNIYIEGDVVGDIVVAGGKILISGEVQGDIIALGGDISILNKVNGDLRIVGGSVFVTNEINGDIIVTAGSVKLTSGSVVDKDVIVAGGNVSIEGAIAGKTDVVGGHVDINAIVDGDVFVGSSENITVGENAVIGGSLTYRVKNKEFLKINERSRIMGNVIFEESKSYDNFRGDVAKALVVAFGVFTFFKIIACLLAILLSVILFNKFSVQMVNGIVKTPGKSFLVGFISLLVVPAVITTLFFTAVGSVIALMLLFGYIILLAIASLYSGVIFGSWIQKLITKSNEIKVNWKNALFGVVVLKIITLIPLIGWIMGLVFFVFAFGSIFTLSYKKFWDER